MNSQAASISAWIAVFDWPSMVAALSVSRQGPASSSAARRKIAARSSNGSARHIGAASLAALIAARASSWVACAVTPSTCACRCGCTTSIGSPPAIRCSPPMVIGRSMRSAASSASRRWSRSRSALPGS